MRRGVTVDSESRTTSSLLLTLPPYSPLKLAQPSSGEQWQGSPQKSSQQSLSSITHSPGVAPPAFLLFSCLFGTPVILAHVAIKPSPVVYFTLHFLNQAELAISSLDETMAPLLAEVGPYIIMASTQLPLFHPCAPAHAPAPARTRAPLSRQRPGTTNGSNGSPRYRRARVLFLFLLGSFRSN